MDKLVLALRNFFLGDPLSTGVQRYRPAQLREIMLSSAKKNSEHYISPFACLVSNLLRTETPGKKKETVLVNDSDRPVRMGQC